MITIDKLKKNFGEKVAVDIEHYEINQGDMLGLVGNNGAGKTTTSSLLSTLLLPTKGEILIDGQKLTRNSQDIKRKISVITQEYSISHDMNIEEIMEYK